MTAGINDTLNAILSYTYIFLERDIGRGVQDLAVASAPSPFSNATPSR